MEHNDFLNKFADFDSHERYDLRENQSPLRLHHSLLPKGDGAILYYPGSGTDYGPLVHFLKLMPLKAVVYVDYLATASEVKEMISDVSRKLGGSDAPRFEPLTARKFSAQNWSWFWPDDVDARRFSSPKNGRGFQCNLELPTGPLKFIFLRTEGHQTYKNLLGTALEPSIVVLQEHGFGCNWSEFGGSSKMFRAAKIAKRLPQTIFVATNTKPWPGYQQEGAYAYQQGQMHTHERAIFICEDRIEHNKI